MIMATRVPSSCSSRKIMKQSCKAVWEFFIAASLVSSLWMRKRYQSWKLSIQCHSERLNAYEMLLIYRSLHLTSFSQSHADVQRFFCQDLAIGSKLCKQSLIHYFSFITKIQALDKHKNMEDCMLKKKKPLSYIIYMSQVKLQAYGLITVSLKTPLTTVFF